MSEVKFRRLDLIHFNDVYDLSSASRFYTRLLERDWRAKLRLFSGDFFFPTILTLTFGGLPAKRFFDLLEVEYATVGNHELDMGETVFKELTRNSSTAWVLCNYKEQASGRALGWAEDFKVFERSGFKIGVFGVIDRFWVEAAIPPEGFVLADFRQKVVEVSRLLREKGCDLVICLTHMATASDEEALGLDSGVDLFLGGHEHEYLVRTKAGRLLLKSGSDYETFSDVKLEESDSPLPDSLPEDFGIRLRGRNTQDAPKSFAISLKKPNGRYFNVRVERVEVGKDCEPHKEFEEYYRKQVEALERTLGVPALGFQGPLSLASSSVRKEENPLANLLTDLMRLCFSTEVSFQNAGGLRGARVLSPGEFLTFLDLRELQPYNEGFKLLSMPGKAILELLNQSYSTLPGEHGRFLHHSGLRVRIDLKKSPPLGLEDIEFEGQPLQPEREYRVSAPDFISQGRDGLFAFEKFAKQPTKEPLSLFDILEAFVKTPSCPRKREEFSLFKKAFPSITDKELRELPSDADTPFESLMDIPEGFKVLSDLKGLSKGCIERLRLYRLAEGIERKGDEFLFTVKSAVEGRILKV